MGVYWKPILHVTSRAGDKGFDVIEQKISGYLQARPKKIKDKQMAIRRQAGKKTARRMGLKPVDHVETIIKIKLMSRIIEEVKLNRLTHQQVSTFVCASRPKITRMMNYRVRGISIEFLLRVASALGLNAEMILTKN